MPNKDTFRIESEALRAKYSEIIRLDHQTANVLMAIQQSCLNRNIIISNSKLIGDMIRFCAERLEFDTAVSEDPKII